MRDYIHITDLALGHLAALTATGGVFALAPGTCDVYNLGTGVGVSVKQLLAYFSKAAGKELAFKSIEQAVTDTLRWQTLNPNGFKPVEAPAAAAATAAAK